MSQCTTLYQNELRLYLLPSILISELQSYKTMLVIFASVSAILLSGLKYEVHGQISEGKLGNAENVVCSEEYAISGHYGL